MILGRDLLTLCMISIHNACVAPAVLAASYGGFRAAIHEQNAVLGRANRFLAGRVTCVATAFKVCKGLPDGAAPMVHTGMPVRPAVAAARGQAYPALDDASAVHLMVLGGSQGARVFSDVVPAALARLSEGLRGRLEVVQQCRAEDLDRVRRAYAETGIAAELDTLGKEGKERREEERGERRGGEGGGGKGEGRRARGGGGDQRSRQRGRRSGRGGRRKKRAEKEGGGGDRRGRTEGRRAASSPRPAGGRCRQATATADRS